MRWERGFDNESSNNGEQTGSGGDDTADSGGVSHVWACCAVVWCPKPT